MMELLTGVLSAFGLSASTGLNAYIPLFIVGLLIPGTVHAAKTSIVRPAVTAATGGLGNTPVAVTEDAVAVSVSVAATAAPFGGILLLAMFFGPVFFIIRWTRKRLNPDLPDQEQS